MLAVNPQNETKGPKKNLCHKKPRRRIFSTLSVKPGSPTGLRWQTGRRSGQGLTVDLSEWACQSAFQSQLWLTFAARP